MSLGYIGICKKHSEDDSAVIYTYSGENWNDDGKSKSGDRYLQDGVIVIHKASLKNEWEENHRDKSIYLDPECKNAFRRSGIPIEYLAWRLLQIIFKYYRKNAAFPDQEMFTQ